MVLAVSNRASPTPSYSGYPSITRSYQYRTLTLSGLPSQTILVQSYNFIQVLQPPTCRNSLGLGYFPFARHYLGNHFCFLFLQVLRCFSSLGSPPPWRVLDLQSSGLPHSDICGSPIVCISPQLFAAYHVLLRLCEPRHPPYALLYFPLMLLRFYAQLLTLLNLSKNLFPYFDDSVSHI
jgi:hypothetical protein